MFHKEGHKIILIALVITVAAILISDTLITSDPWRMAIQSVILILLILILQFFRNPKRQTAINPDHVIAAVDGKVVVIEEVFEKEYFNDTRKQVSIFMSPLNVHVTRYPVGGTVTFSKYHPGKYLVAWHPKSSEENERTTVVVKNENGIEILYRQIAGAMARRIVNYAQEGAGVIQGEDAGFIKFGSRVDLFLPLDAEVDVQLQQNVRGGETVIARLK